MPSLAFPAHPAAGRTSEPAYLRTKTPPATPPLCPYQAPRPCARWRRQARTRLGPAPGAPGCWRQTARPGAAAQPGTKGAAAENLPNRKQVQPPRRHHVSWPRQLARDPSRRAAPCLPAPALRQPWRGGAPGPRVRQRTFAARPPEGPRAICPSPLWPRSRPPAPRRAGPTA